MPSPWLPMTDTLLRNWRAQPQSFNSWDKQIADLALPGLWPPGAQPRLAPFLSIGESILFRDLIQGALTRREGRLRRLIDFGCGSSLPTLGAILPLPEAQRPEQVWALDINDAALEASRHNVAAAGLAQRYRIEPRDMLEVLAAHAQGALPADLVVANPPYVPAPADAQPGFLTPVDGGTDGLRYLRPLLQGPIERGTWVALVASSLSSPARLAQLVDEGFHVLHCGAHTVPFGPYLKSEPIHAHVQVLRGQGEVDFFGLPDGQQGFITLTLLLEKK